MSVKKEKKTFPAHLDSFYDILKWIREKISKYFDEKKLSKIELSVEEALVNIITHAYKKKEGTIELSLEINELVEIVIKDKGPFFNPLLKKHEFDKTEKLEKRELGGLGILFIKEYMDEVIYKREGHYNVLTLRKKI
jgi:anti-sigma regulatory factor (Ser/Thr protein kinase)